MIDNFIQIKQWFCKFTPLFDTFFSSDQLTYQISNSRNKRKQQIINIYKFEWSYWYDIVCFPYCTTRICLSAMYSSFSTVVCKAPSRMRYLSDWSLQKEIIRIFRCFYETRTPIKYAYNSTSTSWTNTENKKNQLFLIKYSLNDECYRWNHENLFILKMEQEL